MGDQGLVGDEGLKRMAQSLHQLGTETLPSPVGLGVSTLPRTLLMHPASHGSSSTESSTLEGRIPKPSPPPTRPDPPPHLLRHGRSVGAKHLVRALQRLPDLHRLVGARVADHHAGNLLRVQQPCLAGPLPEVQHQARGRGRGRGGGGGGGLLVPPPHELEGQEVLPAHVPLDGA